MTHLSIDSQITFLNTRDLNITAQFYEEVIGFPLILDQGGCRIYESAPNAFLGFCERDVVTTECGVILTIVTQDVDRWYGHLKNAGVSIEKLPATNETYGIYHCFFRDPNGYLLEVQRFLDPNWSEPETDD